MSKKPTAKSADSKAIEGSYTDVQNSRSRFELKDGTYRFGDEVGTYTASKLDDSTYRLDCVSTHPDFKGMASCWQVKREKDFFIFKLMPDEIDLIGDERRFKREGGADAVPLTDTSKRASGKAARASAPVTARPVSDFLGFIWDWGHPEWLVLAVESPIGQVSALYASMCGAKRTWSAVAVHPAKKKDDMASLVALVQAKDCAWTVIYRLMCYPIGSRDIEQGTKTAQELSAKLKTRALAFFGEDTSGAMEFSLHRNGKYAGTTSWESQNDPADAAFEKLKLNVPVCYPCRAGKAVWIAVREPWTESIQRADIVDIGEL
jgi:hypothetical protein